MDEEEAKVEVKKAKPAVKKAAKKPEARKPAVIKPTVGRIVHFVDSNNLHRAAIIVSLRAGSAVDLMVFTHVVTWEGARVYSEKNEINTWHWPERE